MLVDECIPFWYKAQEGCPFGKALIGDVTLPKDTTFAEWIAVGYGYTPYIIVLVLLADLLMRRGTRQFALLLFAGLAPGLNEFFVKPFVAEARPGSMGKLYDDAGKLVGSCVLKCGMPSSHASISVGLWLLVFLDAVTRVVPTREKLNRTGQFDPWDWSCVRSCLAMPFTPKDIMTSGQFMGLMLFWSIFLLPVPIARVRIYDHSVDQVAIGGLAGAAYALVWHRVIVFLCNRYRDRLGTTVCGFLQHNYLPAEFRIRQSEDTYLIEPVSRQELESERQQFTSVEAQAV